jgi:hypothetical protein
MAKLPLLEEAVFRRPCLCFRIGHVSKQTLGWQRTWGAVVLAYRLAACAKRTLSQSSAFPRIVTASAMTSPGVQPRQWEPFCANCMFMVVSVRAVTLGFVAVV